MAAQRTHVYEAQVLAPSLLVISLREGQLHAKGIENGTFELALDLLVNRKPTACRNWGSKRSQSQFLRGSGGDSSIEEIQRTPPNSDSHPKPTWADRPTQT